MRLRIKTTFALLLTVAAVSTAPALAQSPDQAPSQAPVPSAPATDKPFRSELALSYSYMRSNAPPGGCGCFNLNGGSATFAWPIKPGRFALAGDVTVDHSGTVSNSGDTLTLSAFSGSAFSSAYRPLTLATLRPGASGPGALQRTPGSGDESSGPECRSSLRSQPRRRFGSLRQSALIRAPRRGRLSADHLRQRRQRPPKQPPHRRRTGGAVLNRTAAAGGRSEDMASLDCRAQIFSRREHSPALGGDS